MAALIGSGMPILRCFETMEKNQNQRIRVISANMARITAQGRPLWEAFANFPKDFDDIVIQMIKVGETAGTLDVRLKNVADYLERIYTLQQKTISQMIYPTVIFHAGIFIPPLVVLVQKGFAAYLAVTLIPLFIIYAFVGASYLAYKTIGSVESLKSAVDLILIYLPVLGNFFRAYAGYRFVMVMAEMMEAGISNAVAAQASADACGNALFRSRIYGILKQLDRGESVTEALRQTRIIPEVPLSLIAAGEESGSMAEMMSRAATLMEDQVNETLKRVSTVAPVLMFLIVAIYAGFIIISTVTSIYKPILDIKP